MNEKPLNREELEEHFQKFKYIPHINKITIAGRIDDIVGNQFQYAVSRNYGKKLPMYRTIVEVPSRIKIGLGGRPYVSHIPIMCVGDLAKETANQNYRAGMFIQGTGRVQNYRVEKPRFANQGQIELLMSTLHLDDPEDEFIKEILNILELNGQKDSFLMTTVAAQKLSLLGNDDFVNEAIVQGLIYMPPSFRRTQKNDTAVLHIKMLIKRPDDLGPVVDSAVADRDIVNVMFYGEQAIELHSKVKDKQGYPILVKGRIESDHYRPQINATDEQQKKKKIMDLLGVTEQHPVLGKILISCRVIDKRQPIIKHDIWGTSLETSRFLSEEDA